MTIYIPTYNRRNYLVRLLDHIIEEVDGLMSTVCGGYISIIVSNNASTDGTSYILSKYTRPFFKYINQPQNIGGDANILLGFKSAQAGYLWILGDDDLPKPGLLGFLVTCLKSYNPDILALKANWVVDIEKKKLNSSKYFSADYVSSTEFIQSINISLTFISSNVVNLDKLSKLENKVAWDVVKGTSFEQLAPFAALLVNGDKFLIISPVAIDATGNKSFDYSVVRSFGVDFPQIVNLLFCKEPRLSKILISKLLISYLPIFIYKTKYNCISTASKQDLYWSEYQEIYSSQWQYWVFVFPLRYLPRFIAFIIIVIARLLR